jgi:hypothetical protein
MPEVRADYLRESKRLANVGKCLHFNADADCGKPIRSHSIQKAGQLRNIAEGGHVYRVGVVPPETVHKPPQIDMLKVGLNKVSTFPGFCDFHDSELFAPIDNFLLNPTDQQVFLYAYRCLCRELFVKRNAVSLMTAMCDRDDLSDHQRNIFQPSKLGHENALRSLEEHKRAFDRTLKRKSIDVHYVCFAITNPWNFQISGVIYPDYDFLGRPIQDLLQAAQIIDLATYFTAPMHDGWALVFAWHPSSDQACLKLTRSLADAITRGARPEDALFRFAFTTSENHAVRISWWDGLSDEKRRAIKKRMSLSLSLTELLPSNYLAVGLEGIAEWELSHVMTNV